MATSTGAAGPPPEVDAVLDTFHPAVAAWVREQFDAPTEVQLRGWDAIGRGGDVLLGAPTGSGKTLAAFLSGIDQLFREPEPESGERLRLLYISPLRALNYDIERNLRAPLQGIRRHAERLGMTVPEIRVGVRTGDTPQSERQRQKRNPPDILITTPESLYVMLTSSTRELFDHVRWMIVDEIHALASSKRGTHLAFTLERLAMRVREQQDRSFQRIGLSATQRPIERIAAFLAGCSDDRPPMHIIDTPGDKQHDLQVVVPVDDMTAVGSKIVANDLSDLDTPTSNSGDTYSIWSALHAELLDHVEEHTSTILFVNSRRLAERLATALNELAQRRQVARHVDAQRAEHEAQGLEWTDETEVDIPADLPTPIVARAHHGSISRETRTEMEELLKSGQLPCIVATSSLELGIDMGAVDLVLLVESPRSVASGLQRIGRAGHNVGDISRGRIYPKHRADLVEAAAVTRLMSRREIEPVHVPELCLDVLAQQLVATCAERAFTDTELLELTRRAWPWRDISEDQFHNLLSLLAGYFPVDEMADIKARVTWDRESGEVRTRSDAARVAITNAGTIPDRGLYGVFTVGGGPGARVGELDEEMVHETRLGDVIVLGSSSWRVEEITRDRVNVSPQPGAIGKPPFWHGEGAGRTVELGRAVGELVRVVADASPEAANVDDPQLAARVDEDDPVDVELLERLEREYLLDRRAARNLVAYVREQVAATGAAPDDRTIVVERFRDELGDWRICILSPFGKPVHAPWAMAIEEHLGAEHGLDATALWSDDGIALRLPDIDALPDIEQLLPDPDELEDLLVRKLGGSALFASRFREVATRALVLPLNSFRKRSPLWLQRMRAADVLRVAQDQASFPMILETYRECMRDVFRLPDLADLLRGIHERRIRIVEVETRTASVMAASLLFDYTGAFMYDYDGDKPSTERRVQALSLDQALLRELLGTGDLRELLELDAIAEVGAELQRTADGRRARTVDQLHDLMRSLGDLSRSELAERTNPEHHDELDEWLAQLRTARRAVPIRMGDGERWISIEDTGDYVHVLGVQAPPGVPGVFLDTSGDPLGRIAARYARTHTPFTTGEVAERWGIPAQGLQERLEGMRASGALLLGGFLPGGRTQEWCDPDVLRRLRRRTLSHLRREIEPADRSALARFLMGWHGLQQPPAGSVAAARDVVVQLEGVEATPLQWERDLVAPRLSSWRAQWLDELVKTGQLTWMGRGVRHGSIQVALYAAPHLELLAPPPDELPDDPDCTVVAEWLGDRGAHFLRDIVDATGIPHERTLAALWRLAAAGYTTNDSWSTLRAGAATPVKLAKAARDAARADAAADGDGGDAQPLPGTSRRTGLRTGRRGRVRRARRGPAAGLPGEVDVRFQGRWSMLPTARAHEDECIAAMSDALLDTFGIVTRHSVQARPVPGGFAAVYRALAVQEEIGGVRRGWFVEGLGGAQFALPEAVDRLRAVREPTGGSPPVVVLRANDPAQPYGAVLAWPEHPTGAATPRRDASSYVVLRDGELLATVSPSGRRLVAWDRDAMPEIARALARVVDQRRVERLAIEQLDEGAVDADTIRAFADTGFVRTPRGLRATPSTVSEVREQLRRGARRVRVGDVQLPTHGARPNDLLP